VTSTGTIGGSSGPPRFGNRRPDLRYARRSSVYVILRSAAGLVAAVRTPKGLFLPGGGVEEAERPQDAAAREVMEECGLAVSVTSEVGSADEYVVPPSGVPIVKASRFFRVVLESGSQERGEGEPDHELVWLTQQEAERDLTYGSHRWAVWGEHERHRDDFR
jgi:8-oxo-dGTP diphosphatase